MHLGAAILLGSVAATWLVYGLVALRGLFRLPRLADAPPISDPERSPLVSIVLAARNEAAHLPTTLETLLRQSYPHLEVIAVNDRSEDATEIILKGFARVDSRLRVLHIQDLPSGWLGKPHALARGSELARGEWLIFTDADVRFAPDTVARALRLAQMRRLDHLTLLARLDLHGLWEHVVLSYFALTFLLAMRPWRVEMPSAGSYMGVGAFQLIRRTVYETIGGHRRLALEVVDDMKLGKLVKQAGFRSGVGLAEEFIRVRWQTGLRNIVEGLTKNMFAGMGFRVDKALATAAGALLFSVVPFLAVGMASGPLRWVAGTAAAAACLLQAAILLGMRASPGYALLHPVGGLVYCLIVLRSMVLALWRGGIIWRGTFYPLAALRRGQV